MSCLMCCLKLPWLNAWWVFSDNLFLFSVDFLCTIVSSGNVLCFESELSCSHWNRYPVQYLILGMLHMNRKLVSWLKTWVSTRCHCHQMSCQWSELFQEVIQVWNIIHVHTITASTFCETKKFLKSYLKCIKWIFNDESETGCSHFLLYLWHQQLNVPYL